MNANVRILDAKGLGIKEGKWCLTIRDPSTNETWYRPFWYKADALKAANEDTLKGHTLRSILANYGTHYFQPLGVAQ